MKKLIIILLFLIASVWLPKPTISGWYWLRLDGNIDLIGAYNSKTETIFFGSVPYKLDELKDGIKWQGPIIPLEDSKTDEL